MSKKSIAEFKRAFKAVKKPAKPDKSTGQLKALLDKAVGDEDGDGFASNIDLIIKAGKRDYLVDLVAYKYAKHFENSDKRPTWLDKVPVDVRDEAMNKVIPNDLSSPVTQVAFSKAVVGKDRTTIAMIVQRDPAAALDLVVNTLEKDCAKLSTDELDAWMQAAPSGGVEDAKRLYGVAIKASLVQGGGKQALHLGTLLSLFSDDELVDFATLNPKLFFRQAMDGLKNAGQQFIDAFSRPELRERMARVDPKAWADFVQRTPMLASLDRVQQRIEEEGIDTRAGKMGAMFEAVLDPKILPLSYTSTMLDSNNVILSGQTELAKARRKEQEKTHANALPMFPDTPGTDCHHMLYITQKMMEMVPGPKPDIHTVNAPEMLMTRRLSDIPGRGILDRGFTGNVFDERGKPTGCVLFTGDDNGKNSHTWLSVDGAFFDPVMGTRGDDVRGAVRYEPTWIIPKRLANCHADGMYVVKDDKLKPAKNAMGFSTGYYLTTNPGQYLTPEERIQADL